MTDIVNRPKGRNSERVPLFQLAHYRTQHFLEFPCCLCAELSGPPTEAAIYIAATGPYCNFWVASCAQDLCGYFGECIHAWYHHLNNSHLILAIVPLEKFWLQADLIEKDYPSRSEYKLHGSTLSLTSMTSSASCTPHSGERYPIRTGKVRYARLPRRTNSLSQ